MFDFHTHTPAWEHASWLAGTPFGVEEFVGFMDTAGIDAAVVLAHDGLFDPTNASNDALAGFVGARRDRLVGFGTVAVRRDGAAEEAERCFRDLGLRGLKLHPWLQGFSMQEPILDPVAEVVQAYDGIVLCHDGTPPYATGLQIAAFARRHPNVPVVLGHGGLHDTWREALAATTETSNVYLCLCGTPPYAARRILAEAPPGKVLFGTDAGLSLEAGQEYAVARVREIDGWGITAEQRTGMLETTPRALLRW